MSRLYFWAVGCRWFTWVLSRWLTDWLSLRDREETGQAHASGAVTNTPTTITTTAPHPPVEYRLGADGRIYIGGKPIEHPNNATIDALEQYLAEIVVKNHLDPELFKDDDTQS